MSLLFPHFLLFGLFWGAYYGWGRRGGGLILGWKNALLIWGAYIRGAYTRGGLFTEFYGIQRLLILSPKTYSRKIPQKSVHENDLFR